MGMWELIVRVFVDLRVARFDRIWFFERLGAWLVWCRYPCGFGVWGLELDV